MGSGGKSSKKSGTTIQGAGVLSNGTTGKYRPASGGVKPKRSKKPRKSVKDDPYQRPGFNKSTRDQIWSNAEAASHDGKVRDPLTNRVMKKDEPWDAGHLKDWEFRKHRAAAQPYGTNIYPRGQFVKDYNNPDHAQPELPTSNQGHAGEGKGDNWKKYLYDRYGTPPP